MLYYTILTILYYILLENLETLRMLWAPPHLSQAPPRRPSPSPRQVGAFGKSQYTTGV